MTYYVHQVPGRLRVKVPFLKHQPAKCALVIDALTGHQGIRKIKVNQLTGSVVISYDQSVIDEGRILNAMEYEGFFDSARAVKNDAPLDRAANRAGKAVGRAALSYLVGRALESNGLSLLAAFI
ncbi:MAG: heavy metal translocating P-type ATPase [Desulfosarcina sp.]|nr:heavy metal translocating P-type ATPase [Desulfobacterales bacterium]